MFRWSPFQINFSQQSRSRNVHIKKKIAFVQCLDDLHFKCICHKQSESGSGFKIMARAGSGSEKNKKSFRIHNTDFYLTIHVETFHEFALLEEDILSETLWQFIWLREGGNVPFIRVIRLQQIASCPVVPAVRWPGSHPCRTSASRDWRMPTAVQPLPAAQQAWGSAPRDWEADPAVPTRSQVCSCTHTSVGFGEQSDLFCAGRDSNDWRI